MKLKSKLTKIAWPENKEYLYKLSGLGGSGELCLTFGVIDDQNSVHVKCTAKVSFLASFHFEGLSTWEKTNEGFDFLTYEEKDFSKNIHKKWEMLADGLNYIENKKGLILEREVQYFNTPENISTIFDPISAATVALIENPNRDVNIFGKQRILQLKTRKEGNAIIVEPVEGLNSTWNKILSNSSLTLNDKNIIQDLEIPSPLKISLGQIGKLKMIFSEEKQITKEEVQSKIETFRK